jgi:hypothetical protein
MNMENLFGDVIYSYSRKQAIADGGQVLLEGDHAQLVKEAGYKWPVYLTTGVFSLIELSCSNPKLCNDFQGVLWDILWMSRMNNRVLSETKRSFEVIISGTGRKRIHQMLITVGPTDIDNPAPCLTIMLPDED